MFWLLILTTRRISLFLLMHQIVRGPAMEEEYRWQRYKYQGKDQKGDKDER